MYFSLHHYSEESQRITIYDTNLDQIMKVVSYPVLTEMNHYGIISAGTVLLIPYIDKSVSPFLLHIKYCEYGQFFEFCP